DFATTRYGKALAQMLLLGYTAKLWGADPAKLSTRVAGGRLKGLDLRTFVLEMVRGTGGKRRHLDGTFYYPRNGYGSIMDAVAAAVGRQHIHCRAHVNGLRHDGSRITHVAVEGSAPQPVEQLVSTLPLTVAVRALQPAAPKAILDLAAGLRFRHLRLAVFVLHKPSFSPNASLYFPDPADPYTRIYEPKNRSRALSPAEETTIVVEIPCSSTDDVWLDDDRKILERICSSLARKNLLLPSDVRAGCTVRLRNAYPILEVGFEDRAGALGEFLESFDNLSLAGRSARFEYTHVHEIFAAAEALVEDLGACASNPLALPSSSECGSESLAA
ncbi:MAG: FAD-dependent oxidoreductase, partial [Rhodothermales bacterium]